MDSEDPSLATGTIRVDASPRTLALVERVLAAARHDILEPVLQGRHDILAGISAKLVVKKDKDELVDLTLRKGNLEILRLAYNVNVKNHRTWMIDMHPGLPLANVDPLISKLGARLEQLRDMRLAKRQARLRSEASEIASILTDLGMADAVTQQGDARRPARSARAEGSDDFAGPR